MLEKWIVALSALNKNLKAGDYQAVENVSHETKAVLRALLPSIPDKNVHAAIESIPNTYENVIESSMISGTASLADMDKFLRFASHAMIDAMSKGAPTAETLN